MKIYQANKSIVSYIYAQPKIVEKIIAQKKFLLKEKINVEKKLYYMFKRNPGVWNMYTL